MSFTQATREVVENRNEHSQMLDNECTIQAQKTTELTKIKQIR